MPSRIRISLLFLALCACTQARSGSRPDPHASDPAVYRAVLDSISVPQARRRPTQLVVVDSTFTVQAHDLEIEKVPEVDKATLSSFQERNKESRSVRYLSTLNLPVAVVVVSRGTLDSFLHNGPDAYWEEFYRRYPGSNGSFLFSSIGYSADGNLAILVLEHGCGGLCGEISNVVVKRELGRWRVTLIQIKIVS